MVSDDLHLSTVPVRGSSKGNLVRQLQLAVIDGPDAGLRKLATGDRMVIGKHESCDVVLSDDTVSRFHCDVTIEAGRAVVSDLEHKARAPQSVRCYVVTVSDTRTEETDTSGRAIAEMLEASGHVVTGRTIVNQSC